MYYYEIFTTFYLEELKYLVVGGLCVNLHGVPRATYDIDIIISMDKPNILKLNRIMKELDYSPRLSVNPDDLAEPMIRSEWIRERNLIAFSYVHRDNQFQILDLILIHPFDFDDVYMRRVVKKGSMMEINLLAINDLIAMKQLSNRKQDLCDIEMLLLIQDFGVLPE